MKRVKILISGLVQGVFFRASTAQLARRLGVFGYCRNLADGRVEVLAEGEEGSLQELLGWCEKGPPGACVTGVEVDWFEGSGDLHEFRVG